ncbi:MAG: acetyltransferase [Rhodospirillaceae bacterium]|jgi:sugar O-acyltransferase (sialic acid O-acetyltransferase NeuD family)|nr:acetyltransferase [Rhodospirillaceae bacterium]
MRRYDKDVVILGTGDGAALVHHFISEEHSGNVVGFSIDGAYIEEPVCHGLPIIPFETLAERHPPERTCIINAVGYLQMNAIRGLFSTKALAQGYELPGFVHPSATIAGNCQIGVNFIALQGVIVEPFVELGDNVFMWSGASVCHHSKIGDNVFLAPRAALAGCVTVGDYCFVGANSTIRSRVTLGERCLVGAGTYINYDTQAESVYRSAPGTRADMKSTDINPLR